MTTSFHFEEDFRFAYGCYSAQLASGAVRRCPDLAGISRLQLAFQCFTERKTRLALIDCLITASLVNRSSHWTAGHFVVFKECAQHSIYYVGAAQPKIIFLVLEDLYGQSSMWMIGAATYNVPLQGGQSVPRIIDAAVERPLLDTNPHACLEHHEGKSVLVTSMHVCQQSGCLSCFLARIRSIEYCPWHNPDYFDCRHLGHFVCVQSDNDSVIRIFGRLGPCPDQPKFWIFHVVRRDELTHIIACKDFAAF